MNTQTLLVSSTPKPHFLDGVAERAVRKTLSGIRHGQITLRDGSGESVYGAPTQRCPHAVTVRVHDPRFYSDMAFGGSIGAGEAYMQGHWSVAHGDDLTALVRILLQNRHVLDGMEAGLARLLTPFQKALHWAARNTRDGSSRNIRAHYDLGNDFFQLFLDPTMMYSSAIFERPDATLEEASIAKLDAICHKLQLQPGDRVIEIGSGWGGFALHAAGRYGCHVTTTTISPSQHALAQARIRAAGLENRVELLLADYRDLKGNYDKLVSIEMIEAVGHQYHDTYFAKCSELLRADGLMLLQAITIADQRYEAARRSVDFIQRYIFPGSCIPAVSTLCDAVKRVTDMRLIDLEDIGPHYATTLKCWRENLMTNLEKVRALGYPEDFIRMWVFYLCYCEGGFIERAIGDVHMVFAKPQAKPAPIRA
jgi:cyclopropane-fatty-acyl-phospholipid synthase